MEIRIQIPTMLRRDCGGVAELSADVTSVSEALRWIKSQYPELYQSLCQETDALRPHVNLFVNNSLVCKRTGLDTQFAQGDSLFIFPSVSGG